MPRSRPLLTLSVLLVLLTIGLGWLYFALAGDTRSRMQALEVSAAVVRLDVRTKELLQEIRRAYQAADSLTLAGRVSLSIGAVPAKTVQLNAFFRRGCVKSFRHEQQDWIVFGSDGKELYACRPDENTYFQIPASCMQAGISALPDPIPSILEACNPSLKLALVPDAAEELCSGASRIELLPDTTLEGTAYQTLRITPEIGRSITTLLVDPRSQLLRQVKREVPADPDDPRVQGRCIIVDYTTIQLNSPIEPSRFAWTPPAGAENIVPPQVLLGHLAPDWVLPDLAGKSLQLSSLRGNVVVLDFWATWCGPCLRALPMLEQLAQETESPKLRILAIAVNREQTQDMVRQFVQQSGLTLTVLWDENAEAAEKYRVKGIPQTVVIGKDGIVKCVTVGIGPESERRLRQAVRSALEASVGVQQ